MLYLFCYYEYIGILDVSLSSATHYQDGGAFRLALYNFPVVHVCETTYSHMSKFNITIKLNEPSQHISPPPPPPMLICLH